MKVSDIMRQPAETVPISASIACAACRMRDLNVGFLGVTEKGRLVGVITDRDIVIRFATGDLSPRKGRVGDCMTRNPLTCRDDETIETAAAMMGDHQIRHLPLFDADNLLVGVLSLDAIAEHCSEHLAGETLGEVVETRMRRTTPKTGTVRMLSDCRACDIGHLMPKDDCGGKVERLDRAVARRDQEKARDASRT